MQLKEAILKQLQKEEGFVSGQTASEMLGVSRTAVWKAIRQLTEDGYTIEAVRNKGYRLLSQPDILSADRISQSLNTVWTGGKIFLFKAKSYTQKM